MSKRLVHNNLAYPWSMKYMSWTVRVRVYLIQNQSEPPQGGTKLINSNQGPSKHILLKLRVVTDILPYYG